VQFFELHLFIKNRIIRFSELRGTLHRSYRCNLVNKKLTEYRWIRIQKIS